MEQRSPEWRLARIGIPTASNFKKIITASGAPSDSAQSYMCRLIGERLLGRSLEEDISNLKWVRHGIEYEDEAVDEFEAISRERVAPVGFVLSDEGPWGCSPDRLLVNKNAALEIKCPAPWTHIEYTLYGPGKDYKQQVQGQMFVGGYDFSYFFSYFPGMPCKIWRYERDESFISKLSAALILFSQNLEKAMKDIEKMEPVNLNMALDVLSQLMPEEC